MKPSQLAHETAPRLPRALALPMAVAVLAGSMALCGSSSASALPRSAVATSRAKPAVAKIYLHRSGRGNREIPAVALPSNWTVAWKFDCQNAPKQRGTFVLFSKHQGHSALKLTNQTGLGGGGQKPFTQAGRYGFGVNTSCGWDMTVESTLPTSK